MVDYPAAYIKAGLQADGKGIAAFFVKQVFGIKVLSAPTRIHIAVCADAVVIGNHGPSVVGEFTNRCCQRLLGTTKKEHCGCK